MSSYSAYRMVVSDMDSCFSGFMHGHGGRQCIMRSAFILLVALQLLFSRFVSFRLSFRALYSFFARPPSSCIYIDSYTLGYVA